MDQIQLIPQDLRRQELLMQAAHLLSSLSKVADGLFSRIEERIRQYDEELLGIDKRAEAAQRKVDLLRSSFGDRVVRIHCSSKYPTPEEIGWQDYLPLYPGTRTEANNDMPMGRGVHVPFSEEVLKEKLQFYTFPYFTPDREHAFPAMDPSQPLGRIPFNRITSVSSLVMFDTSSNPYIGSSAAPIEKTKKKRDEEEGTDVSLAMTGLRINEDNEKEEAGNEDDLLFRYRSNRAEAPAISDLLPSALPELGGIAQDLFFDAIDQAASNSGSSFFSPVRKEPTASSKKASSPGRPSESQAQPKQPIPAPRRSSVVQSVTTSAVPAPPPIPPPPPPPQSLAPPPPPPPGALLTTTAAASMSTPLDGGRASLLDSIRKAGGKPRKGQASVKDLKIEKKKMKHAEKTAPGAGGGDLMSDLINSLKSRRIGISGASESGMSPSAAAKGTKSRAGTIISMTDAASDPTAGAMSRISAMIPAPVAATATRVLDDDADDDSDDDWE